jgi:hypothetical protein
VAYSPPPEMVVARWHNCEFPEGTGIVISRTVPRGLVPSDVDEESKGNLYRT